MTTAARRQHQKHLHVTK